MAGEFLHRSRGRAAHREVPAERVSQDVRSRVPRLVTGCEPCLARRALEQVGEHVGPERLTVLLTQHALSKTGSWLREARISEVPARVMPPLYGNGLDFWPGPPVPLRTSAAVTSSTPRGQRRFNGSATLKVRRPMRLISIST